MKQPRDDGALAALAKELATRYVKENGLDPERGQYDATIVAVIEHAIGYAFRIGYRTRVGEEGAEEKVSSGEALPRTTGKSLPHLSGSVGADDHHGGLSQLLSQCTCQTSAPPKQDVAVKVLGREDLDDVGVLKLSSPEPLGLCEGGADELGARQVHQGTAQNRGADSLAGLVREVRPDVEPNRTSGDVHIGHEEILYKLRARGKYRSNHCYLYFEVERKKRAVSVETSWLPDLPLVRDVLGPLGFAREPRGAWRTSVPIDDFVGVTRRVTRALELLLTEALQLIDEQAP